MNRKYTFKALFTFILLSIIGLSNSDLKAQDGYFNYGSPVGQGNFQGAVQANMRTIAEEFMLLGRVEYGLNDRTNLAAKLGIFDDYVYLGLHAERLHFVSAQDPNLSGSYLVGIQMGDLYGLKAGYNLAYTAKGFKPYLGLQTQYHNDFMFTVPMGVHFKLPDLGGLFTFELTGAVNDHANALAGFSFGYRVGFNGKKSSSPKKSTKAYI